MYFYEKGAFRFVAQHNAPATWTLKRQEEPVFRPHPDSGLGRLILTKQVTHIADIRTTQAYVDRDPNVVASAELAGDRTLLAVPMLKENELIGAINIYRQEVRPFTDKQIELVTELRRPGRHRHREHAAAQRAARIAAAADRHRRRAQGDQPLDLRSAGRCSIRWSNRQDVFAAPTGWLSGLPGTELYHNVASYGFPTKHVEYMRSHPVAADRTSIVGRVVLAGKSVHISDADADPELTLLQARGVERSRTVLGVPLLREGKPIGVLVATRLNVESFTDKQIELVTTFADQAVIAIENVRLFDEVQARTEELSEALERQTATGEVLSVIKPVTERTSARARIRSSRPEQTSAGPTCCILRFEHGKFRLRGANKVEAEYVKWLAQNPPPAGRGSMSGRVVEARTTVHVPDILADADYVRARSESLRRGQQRTMLGVPLMREGVPIGVIALHRTEVCPFTDKQIELVTTFADQAVIAIENVRLVRRGAEPFPRAFPVGGGVARAWRRYPGGQLDARPANRAQYHCRQGDAAFRH